MRALLIGGVRRVATMSNLRLVVVLALSALIWVKLSSRRCYLLWHPSLNSGL